MEARLVCYGMCVWCFVGVCGRLEVFHCLVFFFCACLHDVWKHHVPLVVSPRVTVCSKVVSYGCGTVLWSFSACMRRGGSPCVVFWGFLSFTQGCCVLFSTFCLYVAQWCHVSGVISLSFFACLKHVSIMRQWCGLCRGIVWSRVVSSCGVSSLAWGMVISCGSWLALICPFLTGIPWTVF